MNTSNWKIGDVVQRRWEVHRVLHGGMGVVYILYDREAQEPIAAKTFQDEVFARNPHIAERFSNEARAWINLDHHENIVIAKFLQKIDGKPYLFLEYVSGGDLATWINSRRLAGDLQTVLRFSIQLCDGMVHTRSKGIQVHRDIKAQNCLVTESGVLKITDFGLVKIFQDEHILGVPAANSLTPAIGLTHEGTSLGTCTHMPPEQFDDAKNVDVRADVYSFGIMLFEMLNGSLPFTAKSWAEYEWLHKNPRDAGAWNNKGCALLSIGQQSEALACLQEAKRLRT